MSDGTFYHVAKHIFIYGGWRHYILEESIFDFRYVRLYDIDIPKEKWLNYLQTVETLIRSRVLRRLI